MATGDGGRVRDGKDIPPGSIVACTTKFDEKFQGEVMAFDYGTKFVVISILDIYKYINKRQSFFMFQI